MVSASIILTIFISIRGIPISVRIFFTAIGTATSTDTSGRARRDVGSSASIILRDLQTTSVLGFRVLALVERVEDNTSLAVAGLRRTVQSLDHAVAAIANFLLLANL
jgi:hypothetical protein